MKFKEIQLVGFKSFADKTSIRFEDGVSCIVGPNGCGKSNVADAVRWVLGEQSAKTLRGTSMQDVIFGGTESRRALSYCEVTLVFDNHERMFDIDYEEVAMTRRLYRSGESEYLLNKQSCRLKDIVALLHGVGIGKEGYSIIGQGKVEQIMNAKPEDRRAIFEEATGVMAFKVRKGEIERKLENAEDNLNVFVQRMDEAEKQLKPLEKQAETARKHREFSEELKFNEVNTFLYRHENAQAETDKFRLKIEKYDERLGAIGRELGQIEEDEERERQAIELSDSVLREYNEKLRTYEVGIEHKTGEAKVLHERIKTFRRELQSASEEVDYTLRRTKEIDSLVKESKKKAEKQEKRIRQIKEESDPLVVKISETDAKISLLEQEFSEKRASQISSVESLSEVREKRGGLSARQESVSERMEEVSLAIEKASGRKAEYESQLAECREKKATCALFLDKRAEKEAELVSTVKELSATSQKFTQELISCNSAIVNLGNNLDMYVAMKNRFEGYRDSVRRLQTMAQNDRELKARIKGAIADIVRTEAKYEVAIETAFGGAMQNLVTATSEDAKFLIEYLKRTGGGVVTFLPVSSMRPHYDSREAQRALGEQGALGLADELVSYDSYYDNVIKNLLGNTLICDTIANATLIARKYQHAFKIVTLDGDIVATSGAMTGGSRRKDSGNFLAGERRIQECEEAIDKKKKLAEKLKKAAEDCDREREEAQKELEAFRLEAQKQAADFAAYAQRESVLVDLISDTEKDLVDYRSMLRQLSEKKDDLESEALSTGENEDLLRKIRSEAEEELGRRQEEVDKLHDDRERMAARLQELRMEEVTTLSANSAEKDTVARLEEERISLEKRMTDARESIKQAEAAIAQLSIDEERAALTEEEQQVVAQLRANIAQTEEEKKKMSARQLERGEAKRALQTERESLADSRFKAELEISKIETALENLRQRIQEEYGLTYETALPLKDENYDIVQSYSTVNSLRRKIAALGPVNQNAEADYDELNARYTDMKMQKEDLEKGIADLKSVLEKLRDEMQRKFDEGFNEINANFTQIFKELFGGGKAEMQLDYTECDDPLNAGIEIVACPPGKKLTKISLLSGGERAFTAIAILFAILKSRPMPFCILDEIEAALDEANVDRFAKYLKKFSKETQFIVITHRKPTMNQADTLFGVTMEEKGVSKIVSVKLSEVESKLGGDTVV